MTPFPDDTKYFGKAEQDWMVNFRVRNLGAMVKQLAAAAITVTVDPIEYPNGKFARLHDPEGNPVELWEPRGSHGLPG
jgi:predicted enzyme related to lactoylglutathione lyase